MSQAQRQTDDLQDDERAVFERLADKYEDDLVGEVCNLYLESSSSDTEDAN